MASLHPEFNREKFKDVVHFVCASCSPEELGNLKLHKILYFSDMLKFLSSLQPLTGVEYIKQKFGPTARHLTWAVNELCKEGRLKVVRRDYFGFEKVDYISLTSPSRKRLSNDDVHLLSDVIDFVCSKSAKEISELSHDAAWEAAELGQTIPYYAAPGLVPAPVSEQDIAGAIDEAHRIRPLIDAELAAN